MQSKNFKIIQGRGKTNIADTPSRLNFFKRLDAGEEFDHVRVTVENCIPVALSAKDI